MTLMVTVPVRVAASGAKCQSPAQMLRAADRALYRADCDGYNPVSR